MMVTLGVALTTLSSMQAKPRRQIKSLSEPIGSSSDTFTTSYMKYLIGIGMLTLALILSGILGISQDRTFERYGRGNWEEAMFYLHALSLPLFSFAWPQLTTQFYGANSGPRVSIGFNTLYSYVADTKTCGTSDPRTSSPDLLPPLPYLPIRLPNLHIPAFYIPLLLNVITQLFCVSGVNRLTSKANSLTVSLILVVRKAVSLGISVLLLGGSKGNLCLWIGAAAVLAGSIGYTLGTRVSQKKID